MTAAGEAVRVLVVEDSPPVALLIRRALEAEGLVVDHVGDLAGARERLADTSPDVMVLDIELPDGSGLQLLREHGVPVPVVILSSREDEVDRVVGLELGAEDYVVKPFFPRELATRVRRAATRVQPAATSTLEVGDLVVDLASREVTVGGVQVDLPSREFDLLAHLAASPRQTFTKEDLLRAVWRSSPEWQTLATVTEHVRRVRLKIEEDPGNPRRIVTVSRAGYRLDPVST